MTAPAVESGAAASAGVPSRFKRADTPAGGLGLAVKDVIEGGPGYIAVGGGSNTGLDPKALIWVSDDGARWQSVPLFGDAARGFIEGVAPIPGGGYVAVGRDYLPNDDPEAPITQALVWRSDEGIIWESVPAPESFAGSIMYDVTAAGDGVIAVGCQADFHCHGGRVWASTDGRTWELSDELEMAPFTVSSHDGITVVGGMDNAFDLGHGRANTAVAGDDGWMRSDLATPQSQINGSAGRDDGFLITGYLSHPSGDDLQAAVFNSADGGSWDLVTSKRFDGLVATGITADDDLVLVTGNSFDQKKGVTNPVVLWSHDLESFKPVKFPKKTERDGLTLEDGRLSADGSLALTVGAEAYRPAIWYSVIE